MKQFVSFEEKHRIRSGCDGKGGKGCTVYYYTILYFSYILLWPHEWPVCCQDDLYTVSLNCDTL